MTRNPQHKIGIVALSALLCVAARPVSAAPQESPVLQSLRSLGLPAPEIYAPRVVTLDLGSINAKTFGLTGFEVPSFEVQEMLDTALSYLGVPYRFGGASPRTGFDCSGLVNHVFRQAFGLSLPRTAREIARNGAAVARG